MSGDSHNSEKLRILKTIEKIGSRDFEGADQPGKLQEFLVHEDPEIVLSALKASGHFIQDESLFRSVQRVAEQHPEEEVRSLACSCLGAVLHDGMEYEEEFEFEGDGDEPIVRREFYLEVKHFLLRKVDGLMETMEVRRRALEALGHLGFLPDVRSIILRFYHQAPNTFVRTSAIYAMGMFRNSVYERLILEELFSPQESILLEAIHAAANLELNASEKRLRELSEDPRPDVRCEAVAALGIIGSPATVPAFLDRLEMAHHDKELMEAIQYARTTLQQRRETRSGEPSREDQRIWNEIQGLLDSVENPDI